MVPDIICREDKPEDENFIYATWLNNYRYNSPFAERIPKSIYYEYHKQIAQRIKEHTDTHILVACSTGDEDVIFGYLVYQEYRNPIIHYAYVKGPFQGLGIASELILQSGLDLNHCMFTHWTFDSGWIVDKYSGLTYVPYLI